jgi:hypothetical protein
MTRTLYLALAAALGGCLQFDVQPRSNKPPEAKGSAPATVLLGETVVLDGSASSDPDEDPLTFRWDQVEGAGDPVALTNADTDKATFTAPDRAQRLFFRLLVDDGVAQTAAVVSVDVIVRPNRPPLAVAPGNMTVFVRERVELDGSQSSDPDGDDLFYEWTQVPGAGDPVTLTDALTAEATFTAPEYPQRLFFRLTVTDGLEFSATVVRVDVNEQPNAPPIAAAPEQIDAVTSSVVVLNGSASSDPDDDVLTYRWAQVEGSGEPVQLRDADKAQATFTAPDRGQRLFFKLIVNDGRSDSQPAITRVNVNAAPVAEAGPRFDVPNGTAVILEGSAIDPDGDLIATWKWTVTGAPAGGAACVADPSPCLTGAATPEPTFTPPGKGDYVLQLVASDGTLQSLPDTTRVRALNRAPLAVAGADEISVLNKTTVTLRSGDSMDPDGDALVAYKWTLTSLPPGAIATMTPPGGDVASPNLTLDGKGSYFLELVVTDAEGAPSAPSQLRLNSLNNAPVADAGANRRVTNGVETTISGLHSDPDNDTITYAWTLVDAPPGGEVTLFDNDKQAVRFTPSKKTAKQEPAQCLAGECYVLELVVSDGLEISDPDLVVLTTQNRPPVANAGPDVLDPAGAVTLSGSNSTDPDGDAITTYTWTQIEGPDVTGGDGVIDGLFVSFTPTQPGVYTFDLVVSDGDLSSPPDRVIVRVGDVNRRPVLSLAAVTSVAPEGTAFPNLNATGSTDPDGDNIIITWTRKTGSALFPATRVGATPVITAPPFDPAGAGNSATYEVVAEDDRGLKSALTETVTLSVVPGANYVIVSSAPGATDTPSSGTCGSAAQPCRTLKKALALIDPDANLVGDGRSVLMTSGLFAEITDDTLAEQLQWVSGVDLYGGRDPVTYAVSNVATQIDVKTAPAFASGQYARGLYFGGNIGADVVIENVLLTFNITLATIRIDGIECIGCKATFRNVGVTIPAHSNHVSRGFMISGAGSSPALERMKINIDAGFAGMPHYAVGLHAGAAATLSDSTLTTVIEDACCTTQGALYVEDSTLTVKRSVLAVSGSSIGADAGWSTVRTVGATLSMENSVVVHTVGNSAIGLVQLTGGQVTLLNNTFLGSGSTNLNARGVYLSNPGSLMGNYISGFAIPIDIGFDPGKASLLYGNALSSSTANLVRCPANQSFTAIADVNANAGAACNASSQNWTGNISSSCALVNASAGDYHLNAQIANACKDAGMAASPAGIAPADDLDGQARPAGSAVDIGADEAPAASGG